MALYRAVASLTVPGGQEFHFPHFFLKSRLSFLIFPQTFTHFLPHFGPSGGRVAHPGRPWLRHWPYMLYSHFLVHIKQKPYQICISLEFWQYFFFCQKKIKNWTVSLGLGQIVYYLSFSVTQNQPILCMSAENNYGQKTFGLTQFRWGPTLPPNGWN